MQNGPLPTQAPRVKTLEEAQELIDHLWSLLLKQSEQLKEQAKRIEELEEKLKTNSRNSSKPPSSDGGSNQPIKSKRRSGKRAGGQPGHVGKGRKFFSESEVSHFHDYFVRQQCECGGHVKTTRLSWRHQTIDIPEVKPEINEYRLYAGVCAHCGKHHEASLPDGVSSKVTGPRLLALIGTLSGGYRLSKRLVQSLLQDLFDVELSLGTISQSEQVISEVLEPIVKEAHAHIQESEIVHCDETGHKERGKKQWMWVAIAGSVSVFLASVSRGAAVAKQLLGIDFKGWLISDRYPGYAWVNILNRQVCWAHLLRDFTKISERSGTAGRIGDELLAHGKKMFALWQKVRDGTLSRDSFKRRMCLIQAGVKTSLEAGAACAETKTANTCKGLLKIEPALWAFVHKPGIEPTNNLAERTIRHYVMWRKTSFGAQSKRGSLYIERMMSTVGCCKLQGRNVMDFISDSIHAKWNNVTPPSLVPRVVG